MNNKYKDAFDKINSGDQIGAYEEFNKILEENPSDLFAIFYRALIGFSSVPEQTEQTLKDFEQVANTKGDFQIPAVSYLAILYSNLEEPIKAIEYGEKALKIGTELTLDIYFALSKAYFQLGDPTSLKKSLEYIDKCIEEEPEEISDFYVCKVDILANMNLYSEALDVLSIIYSKFGSSFTYYYLNARLSILMYRAKEKKEDLESAKRAIDTSLQYEENNFSAKMLKVEILSLEKNKDEALKILDTVKDSFEDDIYLVEQFKVYEEAGLYDDIIRLAEEYLKEKEAWRIYYSLAFFKSKKAVLAEEIIEVRNLYLKAFNLSKQVFIFNEIYRINYVINEDQNNLDIVNEMIKLYPTDGRFHFLQAEAKHRLNYEYDEVIESFTNSFKLNYLDELRYYTLIIPLVSKPSKYYKYTKKYATIDPKIISPWEVRKIGIRYMYGEEGYKKNLKKARKYIESAFEQVQDESCMIATYARLFELEGNYEEAFKYYTKAYKLESEEFLPACNCANGYLAHAYINGIGTDVDLIKAKELILEGIKMSQDKSSNIVIYLYSYFALLGEKEFDLNYAKELLELRYPYYRYEITKVLMLKKILEKLNIDSTYLDKDIKDCLKYGDSLNKTYYKENRKKDIIYPSFNNY